MGFTAVAVDVAPELSITVDMEFDGWAFDKIVGIPRGEGVAGGF